MSNLDVALRLRLLNLLSGPANAAKKDLAGLKAAVVGLNGAKGGAAAARDLDKAKTAATGATRAVGDVKREARGLASIQGPRELARDLGKVKAEAAGAAAALERAKQSARRNARGRFSRDGGGGGKPEAADEGATMLALGKRAALAAGGVYAVKRAIDGTIGSAVSFDKAMADVRMKVDGADNPEGYARMERMINGMARQYGIAREEMAGLTAEAGAAGIATKDIEGFMRLAAKASAGWDMGPRDASQRLAEIKAGMQLTIPQMAELGDMIGMLGDKSSAREADIVEMFQRSGAAAKASGVDMKTTLAILTGARSAGMQTDVTARWFSQLTGGLAAAKTAPKKVDEGLRMLGTTAKDVAAGMQRDSMATILDLLGRLDKATGSKKVEAATKIFGKEWWDETTRAGQALPEMIKLLAQLKDEANYKGVLDKNLAIKLGTTASHLERMKALVSEIGDRLGRWTLPGMNGRIESLLEGFKAVDDYLAKRSARESAAGKRARGEELTPEEKDAYVGDQAGVDARAAEIRAEELKRRARGEIRDERRGREYEAARDELARLEADKRAGGTAGKRYRYRDTDYSAEDAEPLLRSDVETRGPQNPVTPAFTRAPLERDAAPEGGTPGTARAMPFLDDPARPYLGPTDEQERAQIDAAKRAILDRGAAKPTAPASPAAEPVAADPDLKRLEALVAAAKRYQQQLDDGGNFGRRGAVERQLGDVKGRLEREAGNADLSPAARGVLDGFLQELDAAKGKVSDALSGIKAELQAALTGADLSAEGAASMAGFTAGLATGGAGAQAEARSTGESVKAALAGQDLSAEGQRMMASLAAGIAAGTPAAVAAAQNAAARVKSAMSGFAGGGSRPISTAMRRSRDGAFTDGVSEMVRNG